MNDRIKKLALKAYNNSGQGTPDDLSSFMQVFSEKFTELIVRECMECAVWVGKMNTDSVPPANTAHAINIRMKKHFGVE